MASNTVRHMDPDGRIVSQEQTRERQTVMVQRFLYGVAALFAEVGVTSLVSEQFIIGALVLIIAALVAFVSWHWPKTAKEMDPATVTKVSGVATNPWAWFAVALLAALVAALPNLIHRIWALSPVVRTVSVPVPDHHQGARIDELRTAFASAIRGQHFYVPKGLPEGGSYIRLTHAPVGVAFTSDPSKNPIAKLTADVIMSDDPVVKELLTGTFFKIPDGYPDAGKMAAVIPLADAHLGRMKGPCFKIRNSDMVKGTNWTCEDHEIGLDIDKVKKIDLQQQITK